MTTQQNIGVDTEALKLAEKISGIHDAPPETDNGDKTMVRNR